MIESLTSNRWFLLSSSSIGRWCNGNTTGFGPVIWGSSPYRPAIFKPFDISKGFFMRSAGCIIELSIVSMTGRHNLSIFKEAEYESLIQSDVS